jgi:hypothetical protein
MATPADSKKNSFNDYSFNRHPMINFIFFIVNIDYKNKFTVEDDSNRVCFQFGGK